MFVSQDKKKDKIMAIAKKPESSRVVTVTTPSLYGSHQSMVVSTDGNGFNYKPKENEVICKDDTHYYVTTKNRLDNGLADPNRYSSKLKIKKTEGG